MLVVAVVTMAMVVVLSAFNGIDALLDDRFSYLDADIEVIPLNDKVIKSEEVNVDSLLTIEGVATCRKVIEERVFAQYEDNQRIVIIKGVEEGFLNDVALDTMIIEGSAQLSIENSPAAIIGIGVKYDLNLMLFEQLFNPLKVSAVLRGMNLRQNMERALNRKLIPVSGVFSINIDFDSDYVIVPIDFASDLLQYKNEYSKLEIELEEGEKVEDVQEHLQSLLGENFDVKTRFQKNELIYKTNRTEKWATFLIMGFIMLIATFNIIAALTLLINEKRNDIKTLTSMGASASSIKRIFFYAGAMINFVGVSLGLGLGLLFVFLQQKFGLIKLEGGLIDHYPVEIDWFDLAAIFVLVLVCGILSSIAPVQIFTRKYANI